MDVTVGNTMESIRILQHKLFLSSRGVIGDILVEISENHELVYRSYTYDLLRHGVL